MHKQIATLAAACLVFGGLGFAGLSTAAAQDQGANANGAATPPPPILLINREYPKPGSAGAPHVKAESAIAQALSQANSTAHYLGMVAISGKQHSLFFHGFDSFADMQKAAMEEMQSSQSSSALEADTQADDALLASKDTGVFVYVKDMSVGGPVAIPNMRFMEITEVKVRPGHDAEWNKLVQVYNGIFGKVPTAHWAAYRLLYGNASGIYLFINPMKSMADIDQDQKDSAQAFSAAPADQQKQLSDLTASATESMGTNLFAFAPNMSYVGSKWKNADPGFWKQ